jgi:pilus assembly protein CpaF
MAIAERSRISRENASEMVDDADQMRPLTSTEQEWKSRINERLLNVLDLSLLETIDIEKAREEIREITSKLMVEESAPLNLRQRKVIIQRIEHEVLGLGPLEPLLADKTISDILVNGAKSVYVERRGKLEKTNVTFNDDAHLMNTIDRIVSAVGRRHRQGIRGDAETLRPGRGGDARLWNALFDRATPG